jgi:uncharacterized protein YggU (UPF0235/DUF167 family)
MGSILGLKKRDVELVKGDKSHDKLLMVSAASLTVEKVRDLLIAYMN